MIKFYHLFFFLFPVLALLPSGAEAQRFRASLYGGVTLSQLDGDRLGGFNKFGLQGGLEVNTILSERWEWSTGLGFTQQGSSRTLNDDPSAAFEKIRLNFVEVPVLIQFNDWKFQVGGGLAYQRLISFQAIDNLGTDVSDTQNYADSHFSVVVSGTFRFNERFGLNVRWRRLLTNLQAEDGAGRLIGRTVGVAGYFFL